MDILAGTKVNAAGTCPAPASPKRSMPHIFRRKRHDSRRRAGRTKFAKFPGRDADKQGATKHPRLLLRGGSQYGYSNHAIGFPQELKSLAIELTRRPSETGVLLIRNLYLIARENPSMTELQVPQVPSQGRLDLDVVGEFVIQTSSVRL